MNLIDQFEYTQPQAYELCVLSVLKDRLNSGDVFVKNSRKFADFNSFLIPKSRWAVEAEQLCNALGSFDIVKRIDEMAEEFLSTRTTNQTLSGRNTQRRGYSIRKRKVSCTWRSGGRIKSIHNVFERAN